MDKLTKCPIIKTDEKLNRVLSIPVSESMKKEIEELEFRGVKAMPTLRVWIQKMLDYIKAEDT